MIRGSGQAQVHVHTSRVRELTRKLQAQEAQEEQGIVLLAYYSLDNMEQNAVRYKYAFAATVQRSPPGQKDTVENDTASFLRFRKAREPGGRNASSREGYGAPRGHTESMAGAVSSKRGREEIEGHVLGDIVIYKWKIIARLQQYG